MGRNTITMKQVRELLRLTVELGLSVRESARRVGIGRTAASEYHSGFLISGLTLSQVSHLSDTELIGVLSLKKITQNKRYQILTNQFEYIEKELRRTGVTLYLLWEEYQKEQPEGYSYSQYCYHFDQWRKHQKASLHIEHKAGDKMYVDFTGSKQKAIDPKTGEVTEYEVFVAVLGCSQYAYIEAVATQTKADWVKVNENALRFFKGVPQAIVPDCLKSAVIKADKYEPIINETYLDFSRHYNTTILPARSLHPKDKALAEGFVKIAYTRIFAPLRNRTFHSVQEINEAFWEQLDKHNGMHFQGRAYSRKDTYQDVELGQLKELPVAAYDYKEYLVTKVQYNYYAYLKPDQHYYSVPVQYTGKKVLISYSSHLVEIFHDNIRIAMHIRDLRPDEYSVDPTYRPPNHQFYADWNADRFLKWAEKIGPEAREVVENVMKRKAHPEQGFNICMGILRLAKKYPQTDFLKACKKASFIGCFSSQFINNTLKNKTFNLEPDEELKQINALIHQNIRGKEYYN